MPDPEPKESLKAGIEGNVELRALVGNNGKTLDLTVLEGEPVFATPALEAIRTWQFHPVLIGAKPLETVSKIQVRFVLILQQAVTDWEIECLKTLQRSLNLVPLRQTPSATRRTVQTVVCRRSEG
jgi:TonB family protein